jgi:4-alpha-glucanotransferase
MLQIIFSLPGLPAIYYGDEAGMEGAADPFNRATFPWDNIDKELHEFTRDLVQKRHENPVLKTGFLSLSAQGEDSICLVRHLKNGKDAFGQKLEGDTFFLRITRDYMNRRADD